MLTVYFAVLTIALCAASLNEASRPAVGVLIASWAVSFLAEVVGLRDMALYVDLATFWALLWTVMKWPSRGAINAAHFVACMVGAHFVFSLTYRLGWHVPGMYMWSLNGLFLAAVMSLINGGQVKGVRRSVFG